MTRSGAFRGAKGCASKKTARALERGRADVARRRRWWQFLRRRLDPDRLVFIDETWLKTNMAPLRGWAPRGARPPGWAPLGHWKTMTFVAALRRQSVTAPCVFDGPINGQCFLAYVEQALLPTLKSGDIQSRIPQGQRCPSTLQGRHSAPFSIPSHQMNAQITSKTQDTLLTKPEMLQCRFLEPGVPLTLPLRAPSPRGEGATYCLALPVTSRIFRSTSLNFYGADRAGCEPGI